MPYMGPYPGGHFSIVDGIVVSHIVASIAALVAVPAAIGAGFGIDQWRTRRHFKRVMRERGHFDVLDRECIRIIGLTSQQEIDHLNEWPERDKERFRIALTRAYQHGTKIEVLWQRVRGAVMDETHIMDVEDGSGDQVVAFYQAR